MAGSKIGGQAAAITNKERHGKNFYREIALLAQEAWKQNGRKPRGFAVNKEAARYGGYVGGSVSRRGDNKLTDEAKQRIKGDIKLGVKPVLKRSDYLKEQEQDNRSRMARMAARFKG